MYTELRLLSVRYEFSDAISIAERKAKHNRDANKTAIADQNKTTIGTNPWENTVSKGEDL